jgi:hypothetical protein
MSHIPYPFERIHPTRYRFFSLGKNKIEKIVDFAPYKSKNVMNLGFGDLLPDGTIDDKTASNNGDIKKVLSTVVMIVKQFTALHPQVIIHFSGSTARRTKLYTRILAMHYDSFIREFEIYGITSAEINIQRRPFDPCAHINYLAFLIKRIKY